MGEAVEHIADPDVSAAGNVQIQIGLPRDEDSRKKLQQTVNNKTDDNSRYGLCIQRKRDDAADHKHDDLHDEDRGNHGSVFSKKLPLCPGLQLG